MIGCIFKQPGSDRCPSPDFPEFQATGSEVLLLGALGMGVIWLTGRALDKITPDNAGLDIAAFLLVLQRIVEAVQKRWEQRGTDAVTASLAQSRPLDDAPTGKPDDPVYDEEGK